MAESTPEQGMELIADLMIAVQGFGNQSLSFAVSGVFEAMVGRAPTKAELQALDAED